MFPEQLKKILNLIKQTGDRVVIFDGANPDDSYVIMDIARYLEATPAPVNAPVATVSAPVVPITPVADEVESVAPVSLEKVVNSSENKKEADLTGEDLTDKINREISMWKNQDKAQSLSEEDKVKKSWQIPPAVKDKAHNIE